MLLPCAQIGGQTSYRADEIGNGAELRRSAPLGAADLLQALADDVGFRTFAPAGFSFDFRDKRLRQSDGDRFHARSVLQERQRRKTKGLQ